MSADPFIYSVQVADIGCGVDPETGERDRERGVSFSLMVSFADLADPTAWQKALETVRLQLLKDPTVIAAGGGL